ncbi:MAG: AMP-binding protein [Candidatus Puniceispirillaceae bacterium]
MAPSQLYEQACLSKTDANYVPLSPVSILKRTARVHPEKPAVIHGAIKRNWGETERRCRKLASALHKRGFGKGDSISILAPNIPEMLECHFAIPMIGAVLNANNTRLDAATIAYILDHCEAQVFFVDTALSDIAIEALSLCKSAPFVIDIDDTQGPSGPLIGTLTYEALLSEGDDDFTYRPPIDEWDAITVGYTSGTTGNPKGVVYSHRGAYLNAVNNTLCWQMPHFPVYLWTLPMFHCNGWCFPWSITILAGCHVFLRQPEAGAIYNALADHKVTHLCGAPIIMSLIANATKQDKRHFSHKVEMMTAAAPPPPAVIKAIENEGVRITHVYGLTEVYGPAVICAWKPEWNHLPDEEKAQVKARQGVAYELQEDCLVLNPDTGEIVPADGQTMGEIVMRGNIVMKGYLKAPEDTKKAFKDGWFWTGDIAVMHEDGYLEIRDRAKDIIISGGENISSIEIEKTLFEHVAIAAAAVVAMPDETWGETPCAFIELAGESQVDAQELDAFFQTRLARFKRPKHYVFGPLPKTSTGKIKKNDLREKAKLLAPHS